MDIEVVTTIWDGGEACAQVSTGSIQTSTAITALHTRTQAVHRPSDLAQQKYSETTSIV